MAQPTRLYFDWNSTTPPLREAIDAMFAAYDGAWGNPSSVHAEGRTARAKLEEARAAVADLVGARPADVVITSGGTEASNIALRSPYVGDEHRADERSSIRGTGFATRGSESAREGAILLAPIEHASIVSVAQRLAELGVEVRSVKVHASGVIDVDDVAAQLAKGGVRLVAVQAVNGETGVVQPVESIAKLAHDRGAVVHVDAIQAIGRVPAPEGGWLAHADTLSLASHKIRGPKGIGALVTRPGHPLKPLLRGGSQERGLRPGTQDAALASGFAVAARVARGSLAEYQAVAPRRDRFERALRSAAKDAVAINGEGTTRAPHVVHASFRGWSSPELVAALDIEGLACSGGPACHSGVPEPSATLVAMFRDHPREHWRLEGPVRFSMPPWTTDEDVDRAIEIVQRVLARGADAMFGAATTAP